MSSILKVDQIQLADGSTPTASDLGLNVSGNTLQVVYQDAATSGTRVTQSSTGSFSSAFSASITPSSTTSKILAIVSFSMGARRDGDQLNTKYRLVRQIGSGSDTELTNAYTSYSDSEYVEVHLRYINHPADAMIVAPKTYSVLDAPNTTDQCTYKIQMIAPNTGYCAGAYFTLMEIAG